MQGYQQGQGHWPGGFDEGMSMIKQRGRADENPSDGRYSEMETDSPRMSIITHALKSLRDKRGGGRGKRPAQGLRGDSSGFPDAKTSRYESGGPPDSMGQDQNDGWRCAKCNRKNIERSNYCIHCYSSRDVGDLPSEGHDLPSEGNSKVDDEKASTLYVFDLLLTTTTSDLFKYFIKWGDMMKFHVFIGEDGNSTGSGIVQYFRWQHAQAALAAGPHFIMKKQIIVSDKKDADPRKSGQVMDILQKHKLHVSNIPTDVTQDELFEYFSQWGNIFSCDIVESKKGDHNFGFVSYTDEEDALKCLKATHNFRDKRMYVRVSDKSKSMIEAVQDPKKISAAVSSLKSLGKNKLFVSNIPTGVTSDELFEHFSMWGKVDACSLGGHIGPNNNYGFVSYNKDDDALKCLNVPHTLQKRRLFVRESDQGKNLTKAATDPKKVQEKNEKCQLFVTNVPVGTTLEEVYDHFVNWGDLANYILRPTATNKLIAFVTYVNEADALRCLDAVHILNGSQLFVRLSNVSKGMQEPLRASDSRKSDVTQDAPAVPARSPQDAPARPARSPQDAPARPARSPQDAPARPARSPQDAPARPARSLQDAPARPARSARSASPVPPIADPPTRRLSISGLTTRISNDHLLYYFSQWGSIEDYELEKDTTGRPTGCAFVVFERQCDAETAVSAKPHIIDRKEIKVTYTKPPKKQPSKTFPSWRGEGHSETVHRPRLPETVKLQRLHEVDHPKYALEQQRFPEDAESRRMPEDFQTPRFPEDVGSQSLPENFQSRRMPEDLQPQRFPEVFQPRMLPIRQSTSESLIPGLKQAEVVPDSLPPPQTLGTEYDCNVSGCFYKGTSLQFERHWTERHEAKVIYLICSFCTMGCVDADDLCEHLDFFHGVEDKIELSKFLQEAKREERDNIHYVMPGSVTKESCMRVAKPARHEPTRLKPPPQQTTDARDVQKCTECTFTGTMDEHFNHWNINHVSELIYQTCPICPKTFMNKESLELHIKHVHQNLKIYMEKEPDDLEADFDEYQNFNLRRSQHETGYHKFQREEVHRSQTHIQTILGMSSGMSSRSSHTGNLSTQTKPTASSSPPLQSGQNVSRHNLVTRLPTQQPVPRLNPPPLATHVPLTPQQHIQSQPTIVSAPQLPYRHLVPPTNTPSQPAVTSHGLVSSFNLSTSSIPKPVPPPPVYPSTASVPKPVPPPLRPSVPLVSSSQPAVASQLYPPAYPQPSDSGIPNTYTKETVVVASRPVVGAQSHIVTPVSYSQAPFQPQVSAQSHQSPIMAPSQSQFGATVASSVGPQTFPQAGDPPQLPVTGEVISQSLQHGSAPQPVQPQMSHPEVLMKQPHVDSQSVTMPSADPCSTPPLDPLDLIIIYKGFQKTQETAAEDEQEKATEDIQEEASKQEQSQNEPETVIDTKVFDELKKSVQPGSVLALRPDWTKTLKVTRPKTTPLDKTNSVKENRFTPPSKVIPKFDRTDSDNVRKFLLWSHIMMERLEDANIKARRRLEAEGDGDDDDDDDDDDGDVEEPKGISEWSSDEETNGRNVNTKVKATLSQSHEYMKARAHTIAQKVVKDYRNQQLEGKTTNTKGQSKKGKGKLGSVDNKVLGKLLQKSIGMVKYQSKNSNVNADLIKKGISWAKQKIIYLLKHDEKIIPTEIDEESRETGFQQRTNDRSRSREGLQHRTGNRGRLRENLHQRTDNHGRSREDHQQRTDNRGRSREDHQQRTDNRGRSSEGAEQRIHNHGQSTQEFQNRRDWNAEDVEVYMDEFGNEDEEYALAYVDEDGVHVMDDSFMMGEGGPVIKGERMDEIGDVYHGIDQWSRSDRIRGEPRSHVQRGYGGGETRSGHRNLDERDLQIYDRGQEEYIKDRFSEEEYLEYGGDDRISFSSRRNSSHSMRRNEDRRSQRIEDQILRNSVLDERHFSPP